MVFYYSILKMAEQVKSIDTIFEMMGWMDPRAATILVNQFGPKFAKDVAVRLIADQHLNAETGESLKHTRDYLKEQLGNMAFTALVMLYLESARTKYEDLDEIGQEINDPEVNGQYQELETYDSRTHFLMPRYRKKR